MTSDLLQISVAPVFPIIHELFQQLRTSSDDDLLQTDDGASGELLSNVFCSISPNKYETKQGANWSSTTTEARLNQVLRGGTYSWSRNRNLVFVELMMGNMSAGERML